MIVIKIKNQMAKKKFVVELNCEHYKQCLEATQLEIVKINT